MQETRVQSLGWADPLEKGTATHSSILARRVPMDRGSWRATVHGVTKSWCCLILGIVNLVTCYHTHILAAAIEKTTTRVQKVAQNERQHSNTHHYEEDNAMISNSL